MDIKIKQFDWKESVENHVRKSHLTKQKLLEMIDKKGNFNRDIENPDKISLTEMIKLSEALDHNFFYDFCDIELPSVTGMDAIKTDSSSEKEMSKILVENNQNLTETNKDLAMTNKKLAEMIEGKEKEINNLKEKLSLYKKTGT